jgi:hypothetical protein
MPRIDLTDDNLLRLNAAAFGAHGAWALADPKSYHETLHGSTLTRADTKDRWFGLAGLGVASQNLAVAEAVGIGAADAKKNALCASGALWGASALMLGYNISSKKQKNDGINITNAVVMAGMSALNIWKGAGGKDKTARVR